MEKKYIKSEIVDAMKEVIAPVVQRLDGIETRLDSLETKVDRLDNEQKRMGEDIKRMDGDIKRMDGDIQVIKRDLAQKPDRDEVKTIIRDELKNNPSVYIFDRDGYKKLMSEWLKEDVERQVKDILRKEKIIA
ncbi:MAG: hypothetical protein HQK88_08305 [Nitrospirae bacterium]|nr:hypothetical protein [Nitrospirota bacterium]MBF0534888.1 hypothetical protein [Nitrospirota bacterium]MBF0616803.1 hypothetical protein [Nitrospirota bacterium]